MQTITVLEEFQQGKYGDEMRCEDIIVHNNDFVAVFDGASSKTNQLFNNKTTGRVAAEILAESLLKIDKYATHAECFQQLNLSIYNWYLDSNLVDDVTINPHNRPTATAAIYSRFYNQIWVLGDNNVLVNDTLYNFPIPMDKFYADTRVLILKYLIDLHVSEESLIEKDLSLEALIPIMNLQSTQQNSIRSGLYAYSILDGFLVNYNAIRVIELPNRGASICITTDGYPEVYNSLEKTERSLARIIKEDPLCYKYFKHYKGVSKGQVSFDDRAFVKFSTS